MKGRKSTKNKKLVLVLAIFLIIMALLIIQTSKSDKLNNNNYTQPTIEYIPEDLHPLQSDGTFKDLRINKYISYDAKKLNLKLTGFSTGGGSINITFPSGTIISIDVNNINFRGSVEDNVSTAKFPYSTKLVPWSKKQLGENIWYIQHYSHEGTLNYYTLESKGIIATANLSFNSSQPDTDSVIAEAEEFLSTIRVKE